MSFWRGDATPARAPVTLPVHASHAALSPDGTTIAYETVGLCGIGINACTTTLDCPVDAAGPRGEVLQLKSPSWVGRTIIVALSCGVWAKTIGASSRASGFNIPTARPSTASALAPPPPRPTAQRSAAAVSAPACGAQTLAPPPVAPSDRHGLRAENQESGS